MPPQMDIDILADIIAEKVVEKMADAGIDYDLLAEKTAAALAKRISLQLVVGNGNGAGYFRKQFKLVP